MKKLILIFLVLTVTNRFAKSQGCIVVRNISGFGQYNLTDNAFSTSAWQLNITNRYFKAFRDFKGTHDQNTPRQDESILHSFSTDITINHLMNNGWSVDLSIPYSVNSRSADIEHGGPGTTRHTTHSSGLGDIRFTAYKWLLKPTANQRGNIQLGLGIKLPTGDYRYQDYFYRNDTTKVLAPVNGTLALGDGGTGIVTELNAFYFLSASVSVYGNFYYLINPRDQNGVSTLTGKTPTPLQIATSFDIYSVPDIYSFRLGANFNRKDWAFSAGLREDGEPVHDLVGGSTGLRRPGHNLSVEPGVLYKMKKTSIYLYVPFLVARKILQNVPDAEATEMTGIYRIGAGGSGNYQIFAGVQFKL